MKKNNLGISLIEIVVVIGVFAVLGILSTRVIALSLQGSKKADAQIKVRENLDYAIGVIERHLRNAESITSCGTNIVHYIDSNNVPASFWCAGIYPDAGYIASGSAIIASGITRLTSEEIIIKSCSFVCTPKTQITPPKVAIDIQAVDAASQGSKEGATVSISTEINLRTY